MAVKKKIKKVVKNIIRRKTSTSVKEIIPEPAPIVTPDIVQPPSESPVIEQQPEPTVLTNEPPVISGSDEAHVVNEPEPHPEPIKPKPQTNSLLDDLLKPTDKDLAGKAQDIAQEIIDEGDEDEEAEDGIPDLKQQRKEAKLEAMVWVGSGCTALNTACKAITGNWDTDKYKIGKDEREMIEKPLKELFLLREKKKRSPGTALLVAVVVVVLPILIMAVVDAIKNSKEKKKKLLQEAEEKKKQEQKDLIAMMKGDIKDVYVDEYIPEKPTLYKRAVGAKKGRHKMSCPAHLDKNAKCNCK